VIRTVVFCILFDNQVFPPTMKAMAIPSAQLETWSHQGGTTISSTAYNSIRHALTKTASPLHGRGVNIFLQGSYANDTNIHADSDIDVVVLYEGTFYKDLTSLPLTQQQAHEAQFGPPTYSWSDLNRDVLAALRSHYGHAAVNPGNKAIKVQTGAGRMTADVIPAVQFRRYATFTDPNNLTAHWGIHFFDARGNGINNYPKYHIERGQDKNRQERTRGRYKPTVRVLKNLRTHLVESGVLTRESAPSYYVECALHNVPDHVFHAQFSESVPQILDHLWLTPFKNLMSQNGVVPLIGVGHTQWTRENYTAFLTAARNAWTSW